jgi:hypothetical protein
MVTAVAVMVEKMHQRACQEKKVGKHAHEMRPVLSPQEIGSYDEKADEYPLAARRLGTVMGKM